MSSTQADTGQVPNLAIITPANSAAIPYLRESAAGIKKALGNAPEWKAHWRIELDGVGIDGTTIEELEIELSQIVAGVNCRSVKISDHGFQAGAAVTRSIAFFDKDMPECDWTLSLDADDILMPDALHVMHEAINSHPDLYYVAGGIIKPSPDHYMGESPTVLNAKEPLWEGELPPGMYEVPASGWHYLKPLIPGGLIPAKGILDFMEESHRFPIFAACVCYQDAA